MSGDILFTRRKSMSIDITIEEMEALPAESYELFDIRGEIERAPQNRSASPISPFAALISASVIQYGTSAGLQFFRHPRHLLGFTLSPAIT